MGVTSKHIWECDRCPDNRTLDRRDEKPDGWGEIRITQYNLEGQDTDTYLCAHCLNAVINLLHEVSAYERAEIDRKRREAGYTTPLPITQPDPQATGGGDAGYRPSLGSDADGGKTFNPKDA